MKKINFNFLIYFLLVFLIVVNLGIFYFSIKVSDDIRENELKIEKIHKENIDLERKLSQLDSLNFAQNVAEKLEFTKEAEPLFLENLKYAFAINQ
jgi:hypothetical protein